MLKFVWAKIAAVMGVTALVVGGSTVAAHASAALPATDTMYSLNCDALNPFVVSTVDTSTGELLGVGTATYNGEDCFSSGAVDPTTGWVYTLDWYYAAPGTLTAIDLATGIRTEIGVLYDYVGDNVLDPYGLAIDSSGNAYLTDSVGGLWSVDLSNGYATEIGSTGYTELYALAFDNNDTLWGMEWGGTGSNIITINTGTGAGTIAGHWPTASGGYDGASSMQFDSNGVLWVQDDGEGGTDTRTVWSVTDTSDFNGSTALEFTTYYGSDDVYWESMIISRGATTAPGLGADPAGGTLWSFTCPSGPYTDDSHVLHDVSLSDASSTGIGAATYVQDLCFGQAAFDPTTKSGYAVDWNMGDLSGFSRINFESGRTSFVAQFHLADDPENYIDPLSMAIDTKGNGYVMTTNYYLYSLNLTDGGITYIGDTATDCYAMAFNPVDDKLYCIDYITNNLVRIDPTDASVTILTDGGALPAAVSSMQFTETGDLLMQVEANGSDGPSLWRSHGHDLTTAAFVGEFRQDGNQYLTESLLYVPVVPTLPDTGLNGVSATVGGLAASFLVGVGAVLMLVRRGRMI